ncbi:MAG: type II secretion system GspH family protein [Planctomycetota bacterium]|nr:type II secretion system GspH family protein [Planctomycetota bacterium]
MMFTPQMAAGNISPRPRATRRSGFTLIEVLVTLLVLSIALPPIMQGIQLATRAASQAKRRDEAANLASSKISQLIADQTWQTNGASSGDFSPDWPNYRWQSSVTNWAQDTSGLGLEQLDVTVSWTQNSREQSILVSTLVFPRNSTQ